MKLSTEREGLVEPLGPCWRSMTVEEFATLAPQGVTLVERDGDCLNVWLHDQIIEALRAPSLDREEVARIVDPEAFRPGLPDRVTPGLVGSIRVEVERRDAALAKADAIRALASRPKPLTHPETSDHAEGEG